MQELRVMVGVPGSGKSTWATKNFPSSLIVSRDNIRKVLVGEDINDKSSYFSKEDEVFRNFVNTINNALNNKISSIVVDATHISKQSRAKLLSHLRPGPDTKLIFEVMVCNLDTCLKRNAGRTGFARVPDSAIKNMYKNFSIPYKHEFDHVNWYGFNDVIINIYDTDKE